jgi:hypothetical protein
VRLLGLTKESPPETNLRKAVRHLLETVLKEAGLPGPLRVAAQSYFASASNDQLVAIVDVMDHVVKELRSAQALDTV